MKAVILAAGIGSRLRPITDVVPKCMVQVCGTPIIECQISNLKKNGIDEICVVAGYKADVLRSYLSAHFPFVRVIENSRYDETNNMYSLFLAKKFVGQEEFLLMNADVFFDENIITGMLENENVSKIACERFRYIDESMKITVENGVINHIGKDVPRSEFYAVSIDVYRVSEMDSIVVFQEIERIIRNQHDENLWTEVALDRVFPYTHFVPYIINGRWMEIDNHDDLCDAECLFSNSISCKI